MDIKDINRTIQELKEDSTTFENCERLAHLYIVREHLFTDEVQKEFDDILPQYIKYTKMKRKYQLGEISEQAIEKQIKSVCKEISEFIHILYTSTDMPSEREMIKSMINGLQTL